jgi:hypothetical protein
MADHPAGTGIGNAAVGHGGGIYRRRVSDRESIVLLHGLGMSGRVRDDVVPMIEAHLEVMAPTLPGPSRRCRAHPRAGEGA